mmetsp:Transcript_8885/g.24607  ORF Transcript_8885/g.24607 Transcript_8885/m.24607 type:complete len:87 (+) Transcript_8885:78-338(+)
MHQCGPRKYTSTPGSGNPQAHFECPVSCTKVLSMLSSVEVKESSKEEEEVDFLLDPASLVPTAFNNRRRFIRRSLRVIPIEEEGFQ